MRKRIGRRIWAWLRKLDRVHDDKGYLVPADMAPLSTRLSRLILAVECRFGNMIKCSTLVDHDGRVICYNKWVRITSHPYYPDAHVEERWTADERYFRHKCLGDPR